MSNSLLSGKVVTMSSREIAGLVKSKWVAGLWAGYLRHKQEAHA